MVEMLLYMSLILQTTKEYRLPRIPQTKFLKILICKISLYSFSLIKWMLQIYQQEKQLRKWDYINSEEIGIFSHVVHQMDKDWHKASNGSERKLKITVKTDFIYQLIILNQYIVINNFHSHYTINQKYQKMSFANPPRPRPRKSTIPKQEKQPQFRKPINKSVQKKTKKFKPPAQVLAQYNLTKSRMVSLIDQQKDKDIMLLKKSVALLHYYETLMSLFMLLYSSSQIIASNIFDSKKQRTGLSGLKFIGFLFSIYEWVWNQKNLTKLRTMAKNMIKMGKTPKKFQEKVQFICRKISLNLNMQKRIKMAFLNPKLQNLWQKVISEIKMKQDVEILEEMYELAPEKMAYWDFTYFVNQYLATEEFYETLKSFDKQKSSQIESDKKELSHNFTYEFFLIEIFCFHEEDEIQEQKLSRQKLCQLI